MDVPHLVIVGKESVSGGVEPLFFTLGDVHGKVLVGLEPFETSRYHVLRDSDAGGEFTLRAGLPASDKSVEKQPGFRGNPAQEILVERGEDVDGVFQGPGGGFELVLAENVGHYHGDSRDSAGEARQGVSLFHNYITPRGQRDHEQHLKTTLRYLKFKFFFKYCKTTRFMFIYFNSTRPSRLHFRSNGCAKGAFSNNIHDSQHPH